MSVIVLDGGNVTECILLDKLTLVTINMNSNIYLGFRYQGGFQEIQLFWTDGTDLPHLDEEEK